MPAYTIDPARSKVVVCARSSIHDTTATWSKVTGSIDADAGTLVEAGAAARVAVDMTAFDAGDFLKNRKLRKDLDVERHPEATFELATLSDVTERGGGEFSAAAEGTLRWRGREAVVRASGSGRVGDDAIDAEATFDLDVRDLDVEPPKFLMFKVDEIVSVTVTLRASRSPRP